MRGRSATKTFIHTLILPNLAREKGEKDFMLLFYYQCTKTINYDYRRYHN